VNGFLKGQPLFTLLLALRGLPTMKHTYLIWSTLCLLISLPLASRAQTGGVRIGTNGSPDASAILDLSPDTGTPKGLLPPRLTLAQRTAIANPATGLVLYQTDGIPGLYLYNGTAWVLQGDNLGSHTATQNLNLGTYRLVGGGGSQGLSISTAGRVGIGLGTAAPTQQVEVGGQLAPALLLHSNGNGLMNGATLQLRENDLTYGWNLRHNSGGSEDGSTSDRLVLESVNGGPATPVMTWDQGSGNVGIGTTTPAYPLDVTGDAQISGSLKLGYLTLTATVTVLSGYVVGYTLVCPAGTRLLGGGGGYRQLGTAAQTNVSINYVGPDPDNPQTRWLLSVYNNASTSRDVFITCNCARIQ
jgi:hypothetical protein